ncbi:hypothetical protein [Streptomyces sp. NPDC046859]|uniref:hypothetical protein n=1 Tax=Streptomyces sp. NPDC046859 TaxID=3155734 RepID=UPI003406D96C
MPSSSRTRPMTPPTVWSARGRHRGPAARDDLLTALTRHKDSGTLDDFRERPGPDGSDATAFEARWRVAGAVTVRARLELAESGGDARVWTLAAEAEAPWDPRWPSPAALFWPEEDDAPWAHDAATGLPLGTVNLLPTDDKAVRRLLRDAVRDGGSVHVLVHEAMTTDERGRTPLAGMLPPGLRHRVVEHRAVPSQLRVVNYALRDLGPQLPRGGAVVLPATPAPSGYDPDDFTVRTVFLDGTEPAELIHAVTRYAALPHALPAGADGTLTALRDDWSLLTVEEELRRERELVRMYAEALDAMTKSRDLYREAAEEAHAALAAFRESADAVAALPPAPPADPAASPLQQLTRTFERLKASAWVRKQATAPEEAAERPRENADR